MMKFITYLCWDFSSTMLMEWTRCILTVKTSKEIDLCYIRQKHNEKWLFYNSRCGYDWNIKLLLHAKLYWSPHGVKIEHN